MRRLKPCRGPLRPAKLAVRAARLRHPGRFLVAAMRYGSVNLSFSHLSRFLVAHFAAWPCTFALFHLFLPEPPATSGATLRRPFWTMLGSDLVWYCPYAARRSSFSCRRHSGVLTSWVTLCAVPPSVTQMPMLRLPMLRLAASRCAPFLRSRHNQAGRPCVGQPGGWPRRSGGGLATAARTLCAACQRRRGASLRVAASPSAARRAPAQRARQTCLIGPATGTATGQR